MSSITLQFPGKQVIRAELLQEQEPALVKDFLQAVGSGVQMVCNHSVCEGQIFDAYPRFSAEPPAKVEGGRTEKAQLSAGDLLWDGEKLTVVYGDVYAPGTAGAVIGKAEVGPEFEKACKYVWFDLFREHRVSVITVNKE